MASTNAKLGPLPILLLVLGAVCIGLGIFYLTMDTSLLADDFGRHPTHGIAFTGLGIVLAVAGLSAWRRKR